MTCVVAVEGIDGAGKSHLCGLLADRLRRRGLHVRVFDKHAAALGADFAGRRMAELRAILWPSEAEPAQDPLGTHFYLHLLASWFHGLGRLTRDASQDCDVLLTDGSFHRVIAKAHARANLDLGWLSSLFEHALQPDRVLLLDIDPILAWGRRTAFKPTEIGRWDGEVDDARSSFCAYQAKIRAVLLDFAAQKGWTTLHQESETTPEQTAAAADDALAGLGQGEAVDHRTRQQLG